jgi:tRNA (guanine37-N1)-methyltransferase
MNIAVITLFPEMFNALNYGITGRAIKNALLTLSYWNPRDYTDDVHRTVDDRPYGGGPGMVMKFEPLKKAIDAARLKGYKQAPCIYLTPQGKPLNQSDVKKLSEKSELILLSGRYEGIDERLIEQEVDEEYSIGDYVLSGGELPAMVMIDALTRLLPNALGHEDSAKQDSFSDGLLDCPHYTRPEVINGMTVPEVLLSGHHEAINYWRAEQSLIRTWQRRQDLLKSRAFSYKEEELLNRFRNNPIIKKTEENHE